MPDGCLPPVSAFTDASENFIRFLLPLLIVAPDMQTSRPASTSTRPALSPLPRQHQVNTQTKVLDTTHGRILCIADIRGRLSALNDLARDANAKAIIHTGDFGFFGVFYIVYRYSIFTENSLKSPTVLKGSMTELCAISQCTRR